MKINGKFLKTAVAKCAAGVEAGTGLAHQTKRLTFKDLQGHIRYRMDFFPVSGPKYSSFLCVYSWFTNNL